jgi:hypothetical protein
MHILYAVAAAVILTTIATVASAVTPPPATTAAGGKVKFDWVLPVTRQNGAALATSEIAQTTLYVESFLAPIVVSGTATTLTYVLPVGVCIKATDRVWATVTDTSGAAGAASDPVLMDTEVCGPKSPARAPTLKATAVPSTGS